MVYDAVAVQEENVDHVPNFNDVRTQLERYRAALVPPIPYEVEDVVIPEELTGTESGRRVIPFDMGLMTERTIWAYRQIFQHVKARVRQVTRHHLRPQRVLMDFEVGLMTATETESLMVVQERSSEEKGRRSREEEQTAVTSSKIRQCVKFLEWIPAVATSAQPCIQSQCPMKKRSIYFSAPARDEWIKQNLANFLIGEDRMQFQFNVHGTELCRNAWCRAYGIDKNAYYKHLNDFTLGLEWEGLRRGRLCPAGRRCAFVMPCWKKMLKEFSLDQRIWEELVDGRSHLYFYVHFA
uniref:Uncharacterized protein n=1 Tax=Branchiostoma floridae TaxID=7739 RepID=C3ZUJ2_BRAFL|eukprot:XP_002587693.1 hypothetical protein BRAFLDRAFT_94596 [Branchiostoma floridae]